MLSKEELISFEQSIADSFNRGEIKAPIHLSGGNEEVLINIFEDFRKGDFCFSSWRNHYHALLAGVPPEEVKRQIMAGRSMTVCSPKHRFFSSAIVGGCIPIALGVAWQIKRMGGKERVFLFIGDMTAMSGMAYECAEYRKNHNLPLYFIIEDNGKSVCTDTRLVWNIESGQNQFGHIPPLLIWKNHFTANDLYYQFQLPWPHSGSGKRINF